MDRKKNIGVIITLMLVLALLILDSKTAIQGATDGISLCLAVVIPSLFPFIVLTTMLQSRLLGMDFKVFTPLSNICGIPKGAESLVLLSFLGGYPVGAAIITDAYHQGSISKSAASRMLGFCNNAGPAFLFGIAGSIFCERAAVWCLWFIHIFSALLVGILLPQKEKTSCNLKSKVPITLINALESGMKTMGKICCWVVIFRIVFNVLNRWVLWLLPPSMQISICGILELSNGIISLKNINNSGLRFILCSGMLALGGLCVYMQTKSVTRDLGTGQYFPGKILQCLLSIFFSSIFQLFLFPRDLQVFLPVPFYIVLAGSVFLTIFYVVRKKVVANPVHLLYNDVKSGT